MFSVLSALKWRPILPAAFSRLCSLFLSRELSWFDVYLIINNFREKLICNFWEFSKQVFEMFFLHEYSFFLTGCF